jgi:hypothetical protein
MPFSNETTALFRFIPSASPTISETITKDKNELNFRTSIMKRRRQIPRMTITNGINWVFIGSRKYVFFTTENTD